MEQFYPLILLGAVAVLFKVGLLPFYKRGPKSTNNILFAQTAYDDVLEKSGNNKEGVDNQERSEAVWRVLFPGLLLSWMPFVDIHYACWGLGTLFLSLIWVTMFRKNFDGYGHTVEIITVDDPDYEKREIESMKRQSHFSKMSIEEITDFVQKKKPLARLWKKVML
jgi:hypothetical protein